MLNNIQFKMKSAFYIKLNYLIIVFHKVDQNKHQNPQCAALVVGENRLKYDDLWVRMKCVEWKVKRERKSNKNRSK